MKPLNEITKAHKEYFAYISKLGKTIDKSFNKEAQNLCLNAEIPSDYLNSTISEHYLREGKFHIYESLNGEADEPANLEFERAMKLLHQILSECKNKNFEPAIEWAEKNEKPLKDIQSDLLYELHEFKFNHIHRTMGKDAAMKYARDNFRKFFPVYGLEIQKLMMSLNPRQVNTEEGSLPTDSDKAETLIGEIAYTACRIYTLETTPQSAISLIAATGTLALPRFVKYFSLYSMRNRTERLDQRGRNSYCIRLHKGKSVPLNLHLPGHKGSYHRGKSCYDAQMWPRDFGARLAMKRIAHINHMKIKCPYCPTDNTISTVKKIYFN